MCAWRGCVGRIDVKRTSHSNTEMIVINPFVQKSHTRSRSWVKPYAIYIMHTQFDNQPKIPLYTDYPDQ